ncbi:hypothetical protein MTBBW1_2410008 [Desulfamplus magnetovallimortis]|uniref:Uncharacterized protein n=1 Tax=Desulfamplus magnetovallimortis TaxID=1246637 RepID=A0A1W1HE99_9BACT|nr:CFI-box-CTERM domain-containing protein [Desulfamplus magnetovallimortis]SLM30790.1 hypothetical protein MTBBW1_2410008 [Desulfamplus magnetovallimortis]
MSFDKMNLKEKEDFINYLENLSPPEQELWKMRIKEAIEEDGDDDEDEYDGSCFIATVCFGSYSNEVAKLQHFRDGTLANYQLGRFFIKIYYKYSPSIAKFLKKNSEIRLFTKKYLIMPIIHLIK